MKLHILLAYTIILTSITPIYAMHDPALRACVAQFEVIVNDAGLDKSAIEIKTETMLNIILESKERVLLGIGNATLPQFEYMKKRLDLFAQTSTGNAYAYININDIPTLKDTYQLKDEITILTISKGNIIYRSDAQSE
jgi:hypothetical protein